MRNWKDVEFIEAIKRKLLSGDRFEVNFFRMETKGE